MVTMVKMPKMSLTMIKGTVAKWFKEEGDTVQEKEPLAEIIGEKATYDLEAPTSGILRKIIAPEEMDIDVGEVIAIIGEADEVLPPIEKIAPIETPKRELIEEKVALPVKAEEATERVQASPLARKIAREHGVDLRQIRGSGPRGRIVERDVMKYVEEGTPKVKEVIPLAGVRKTIAERMVSSTREKPQFTVSAQVDASEMVKLREEIKKSLNIRISYTEILVRATAKALEEHTIMNSILEDEEIKVYEDINIGVAVATERGLFVPVVRNANKKTLTDLVPILAELVEKARKGTLSKDEMTGGTFTITNLGMFGADMFTPLINPPECAVLGVGKIVERPAVVNGKVVIRPELWLSLSFDHRIIDGAPATHFLMTIKRILEKPTMNRD